VLRLSQRVTHRYDTKEEEEEEEEEEDREQFFKVTVYNQRI